MSERDKRDRSDFERALGAWGRRAPRTAPETAARLVKRRLVGPSPPRWSPRLAWVAATLIVVAAGTWYVVRNGDGGSPVVLPPAVTDITTAPLDDNVVLWWLDEETPVYFVLNTPELEENQDEEP